MFVGLMGKRTLGGGEIIPFSSLSTLPLRQYYSTGWDSTYLHLIHFACISSTFLNGFVCGRCFSDLVEYLDSDDY